MNEFTWEYQNQDIQLPKGKLTGTLDNDSNSPNKNNNIPNRKTKKAITQSKNIYLRKVMNNKYCDTHASTKSKRFTKPYNEEKK